MPEMHNRNILDRCRMVEKCHTVIVKTVMSTYIPVTCCSLKRQPKQIRQKNKPEFKLEHYHNLFVETPSSLALLVNDTFNSIHRL